MCDSIADNMHIPTEDTHMKFDWSALRKAFPFPNLHPFVENTVFGTAEKLSRDYRGGQWTAETVGNFTILVPPEGQYNVNVASNYYSGEMDNMTYGAALTLLLFNHFLWDYYSKGKLDEDTMEDRSTMFYEMKDAICADGRFDYSEIAAFLD